MRKLLFLILALLLAVPVLAQEADPRAVLEKAVAAHGGAQVLSRFTVALAHRFESA